MANKVYHELQSNLVVISKHSFIIYIYIYVYMCVCVSFISHKSILKTLVSILYSVSWDYMSGNHGKHFLCNIAMFMIFRPLSIKSEWNPKYNKSLPSSPANRPTFHYWASYDYTEASTGISRFADHTDLKTLRYIHAYCRITVWFGGTS